MVMNRQLSQLALTLSVSAMVGWGMVQGVAQAQSVNASASGSTSWTGQLLNWVKGRTPTPARPNSQGTLLVSFEPPDKGLPGNREGGASRGGLCTPSEHPLTAITPDSHLGLTLADRPSFFVYVPATNATQAEFSLMNQNQEEVYMASLPLPGREGIVRVDLPEGAPALVVGQNYNWSFSMVCDAQDPSANKVVSGWVQRVSPSAALRQELKGASPQENPYLYAQAGLWYETLASLVDLQGAHPTNAKLTEDWNALLQSVGLGDLAQVPLQVQ